MAESKFTFYVVSYQGMNGDGAVNTVAGVSPDLTGDVPLTAGDLPSVGLDYSGSETLAADIVALRPLVFQNVTVDEDDWTGDSELPDYPWQVEVECLGVNPLMFAEVVFSASDAKSGNFAPIAETIDDGVRLYARKKPSDDIEIPTIRCVR